MDRGILDGNEEDDIFKTIYLMTRYLEYFYTFSTRLVELSMLHV